MIDNKKVSGNHQKGIERVKQRGGEKGRCGQPGKMGSKHHSDASFKRPAHGSLTPRKA